MAPRIIPITPLRDNAIAPSELIEPFAPLTTAIASAEPPANIKPIAPNPVNTPNIRSIFHYYLRFDRSIVSIKSLSSVILPCH